jgi:hypothetical protein
MTISDLDPPVTDLEGVAVACRDQLSEDDAGLMNPDAAPVVAGLPVPIGADAASVILHQILAPIPSGLRGLRDRAILLTGFAGALRRSELAPIRVEQLGQN